MSKLIRRWSDDLFGELFAHRLVATIIVPRTFTVSAGKVDMNARVEVHDVHGATYTGDDSQHCPSGPRGGSSKTGPADLSDDSMRPHLARTFDESTLPLAQVSDLA